MWGTEENGMEVSWKTKKKKKKELPYDLAIQPLGVYPKETKILIRKYTCTLSVLCVENPIDKRSLVGFSLWGHKELDTTEQLMHIHTHTHTH